MLEMRIAVLKEQLSQAKIIDPTTLDNGTVQILSTVEMKNLTNGMQMRYTIVSETEADLRQGKISSATPIAQGLLGHKVGDKVSVTTPMGALQLEILKITFE